MAHAPRSLRPLGAPATPQAARLEVNRAYDIRRRKAAPWRKLYDTAQWQALRMAQLTDNPLCAWCLRDGLTREATVVHHVVPHKGNRALFFSGPFESLCKPHHDRDAQREERSAEAPGGA